MARAGGNGYTHIRVRKIIRDRFQKLAGRTHFWEALGFEVAPGTSAEVVDGIVGGLNYLANVIRILHDYHVANSEEIADCPECKGIMVSHVLELNGLIDIAEREAKA